MGYIPETDENRNTNYILVHYGLDTVLRWLDPNFKHKIEVWQDESWWSKWSGRIRRDWKELRGVSCE
jgi:hypothetical protein